MKKSYWIRTEVGFFGPFKSRRKANRARYGQGDYRRTESGYFLSLATNRADRGDVVLASAEDVNGWEECMAIDRDMIAAAR